MVHGSDITGPRPPELAPPPRAVPLSIQLQLLENPVLLIVGSIFVLVSSMVIIVPQFAEGNRIEGPWHFFPFIHLTVGLGMIIVPLVAWRRKVAILKLGLLAPARIVAIHNPAMVPSSSEDSNGVGNSDGPWMDFEFGFAKARSFWARTLPAALPGSFNPASTIIKGFGCIMLFFGAFTVLFFAVGLAFIWLRGNQPVQEKALWTLLGLAFLAVYLGAIWFGRRWTAKMANFTGGNLPIGQMGIPSTFGCSFVYSSWEGEKEGTAYLDLRQRFQTGQSNPLDLVVYIPNEPKRALLLSGLWPPIWVQDGEWVRG